MKTARRMRVNPAAIGISALRLGIMAAVAPVLFAALFATGGFGAFDFWWSMAALGAGLTAWAAGWDRTFVPQLGVDARRGWGHTLGWGILSAAALYAVFFAGNVVLRALPIGAGAAGIDQVYELKTGVSTARVAWLIALVIGPAEELFWRAFLQRQLSARLGATRGVVLSVLLYTVAHIASGNPVLVLAAFVGGGFWGLLYAHRGSAWINVISHTVWDLAVFLWIPFG
ncbi:MAG: CPBP family intramembrane metalloprotease [Kiritimatiellae bacterium]|nr:CPBP family intramembrane metalloprotease [Kiritimatiellia bacterium]